MVGVKYQGLFLPWKQFQHLFSMPNPGNRKKISINHEADQLRYFFFSKQTICELLLAAAKSLATPQTEAHQAPLSLGFSRQEHWSGLPFPSPMREVKSERKLAQSCPTLCNPMDCSLPGPSVHGIFQTRVLEWGAIAFSELLLIRQ